MEKKCLIECLVWNQKFMLVASIALMITSLKMHFVEPNTDPIKEIVRNWGLAPFVDLRV